MLRRKIGLRTNNLKELRVKPVPTWCTSRSHMTKAKLCRIIITTSQSKLLPLRRRRRRTRRRRRRMRIASCADLLIIGQKVSKSQRKKTST
jgi:hypothetical protein